MVHYAGFAGKTLPSGLYMQFAFPLALWGLLALAIPVIIHLIYFRRHQTIFFSNTRFLLQVQEEKRTRNQLRRWLILLSRLGLVAMVVLAFAEPRWPGAWDAEKNPGGRVVSIYIDNAYPMEAEGIQGPLLDQAMRTATDLVAALQPNDRVQILTNEFGPESYRWLNPAEARQSITSIVPTPQHRSLDQVLLRQQDLLTPEGGGRAFLFSDFRKGFAAVTSLPSDTLNHFALFPFTPNEIKNLYVDSVWFAQPDRLPGGEAQLFARIQNIGPEPYTDLPVLFYLNGEPATPATVSIPAQGQAEALFTFRFPEPGWHTATVEVEDEALRFDDAFHLAFQVRQEIRILELYGPQAPDYFQRLFGKDSLFAFRRIPIQKLDQGQLPLTDLILLHGVPDPSSGLHAALGNAVEQGATVVLLPPQPFQSAAYAGLANFGCPLLTLKDTSKTSFAPITAENPFFADVFDRIDPRMDLPRFSQTFGLQKTSLAIEQVYLRFLNGSPAMAAYPKGKGKWVVLAAPMMEPYSNFSRHALFVPVFYKLAFQSIRSYPLYFFLGQTQGFPAPTLAEQQDPVFHLKHTQSGRSFIPARKMVAGQWTLWLDDQVTDPGFYALQFQESLQAIFALNIHRGQANLQPVPSDQLVEFFQNQGLPHVEVSPSASTAEAIQTLKADAGTDLWRWFVMAALVFLLCEMLLIRLWKS